MPQFFANSSYHVLAWLFLSLFLRFSYPTSLPPGYPCEIFESTSPTNGTFCPQSPDCQGFESRKYRNIDGTCNNVHVDPRWGSTKTEFTRFVKRNPLEAYGYPPKFFVINARRKLPSARKVSSVIHGGQDEDFKNFTTMLMQFGQFLDHDLTLTAEMNMCHEQEESNCVEEEMDCCEYIGKKEVPKGCYPIDVPLDDPFYRVHYPQPKCLDFKRSLPFPCNYSEERPQIREQFNDLTSFVDASHIYDVEEAKTRALRTLSDGLLRESPGGLMPFEKQRSCNNSQSAHKFFFSGDIRANENPGLQSHHTLWLREHNRLARLIKAKRPNLDDETIFQEARRLVAAEWQNIVYCEFLPVLLGPKQMKKFDLDLGGQRKTHYKQYLNPSIFNSFATAAFRFGHSLISSKIPLMTSDLALDKSENLADNFFNTTLMREGKMDTMMRGMCFQDAEMPNNILTDAIRNFLFKKPGSFFGSDLAARNIQRGRDHELGSYNSYRQACGLRSLPGSFFSQPPPEVKAKMWTKFSKVYQHPWDIELFPGAMSEKLVEGGILGPTFACIIGEQFRRLMYGDRYFFTHENVNRKIRFCDAELGQIRNRTMRDVMCENTDLAEITPDPFKSPEFEGNEVVPCSRFNPLEPTDEECVSEENDYDRFVPTSDFSNPAANDGDVALLAGGFDGLEVLDSVELYSPNGSCQHNLEPLPEPTYGLLLTYCAGVILACGGRTPNGLGGRRCWRYGRENGKGHWIEDDLMAMTKPRWLTSGAEVAGRYYVAGGWSSPNTTEYFDGTSKSWQPFVAMANSRRRHCIVGYRDSFILIGGTDTGSMVEQFNLTTSKWASLPPLTTFRDRHSCILLSEEEGLILAFGGTRLATVYQIEAGKSFLLSTASDVSRGFAGALDLNGRVYLLGGDSHTTKVEAYDREKMAFEAQDVGLKEPRSRFGFTTVPARLFQHLPGGCRP